MQFWAHKALYGKKCETLNWHNVVV